MADLNPAGSRGVDVHIGAEPEVLDLAPEGAEDADAVAVLAPEDEQNALPKRAELLADGSVRLVLRQAVTLRYRAAGQTTATEETYDALHFRRLTGADMRAIGTAPETDRGVVALSRSTGVRPALMHLLYDRMDGADAVAAGDVVGFLLGNGRTTGR